MEISESDKDFESRLVQLKAARDKLLAFHKLLIDNEKRELERLSGAITPGQYLNLLMNDERFEWLRTISKLIVRIDEAFDADDGIPTKIVEKFESEINSMFDGSESNNGFKAELSARMPLLPEADLIRVEIEQMFK